MPEWMWSIAVGVVVVGLLGVVWRAHETRDEERNERLWDQVGRDSESGMRKITHLCANEITAQKGDIREAGKRLDRIERVLNGKLQ